MGILSSPFAIRSAAPALPNWLTGLQQRQASALAYWFKVTEVIFVAVNAVLMKEQ